MQNWAIFIWFPNAHLRLISSLFSLRIINEFENNKSRAFLTERTTLASNWDNVINVHELHLNAPYNNIVKT